MSDPTATVYSEALDGRGRFRCQLVVVDGPDRGRACRLTDREVTVGTDAGVDLRLSDDRVSGRHLAVRIDDGRFALRDLPPGPADRNDAPPECGLFCASAEQEYSA